MILWLDRSWRQLGRIHKLLQRLFYKPAANFGRRSPKDAASGELVEHLN